MLSSSRIVLGCKFCLLRKRSLCRKGYSVYSKRLSKLKFSYSAPSLPTPHRTINSIAIEAAIVRIMKARKTIGHPQLVAEVLSQLSFFRPNPKASVEKREPAARVETLNVRDLDPAGQEVVGELPGKRLACFMLSMCDVLRRNHLLLLLTTRYLE